MIVFDLSCRSGHRFEGWFASADDFASQQERNLLTCPSCNSAQVRRVPSATRINVIAGTPAAESRESAPAQPQQAPVPAGADPLALAQKLYSRMVDEILTKTEDVGREFPSEARKIHYEEAPKRAIRGVATQEEHDSLVEEGIPVARVPVPPSGSWH